jgi:hypothetical protein
MKQRPTVYLDRTRSWNESFYDTDENEIFIGDDHYRRAALYHEYRHYLQFRNLPPVVHKVFMRGKNACEMCLSFMLMLGAFGCADYLAWPVLFFSPFVLVWEWDANFFAMRRLRRKRDYSGLRAILFSLLFYTFLLAGIPLAYILN